MAQMEGYFNSWKFDISRLSEEEKDKIKEYLKELMENEYDDGSYFAEIMLDRENYDIEECEGIAAYVVEAIREFFQFLEEEQMDVIAFGSGYVCYPGTGEEDDKWSFKYENKKLKFKPKRSLW